MSDSTASITHQNLWSGRAPLASGDEAGDIPSIKSYLPAEPDGSAIVVCPGGAYQMLAEHEGDPVARWLNTLGITAFVLTYRLGPKYRYPSQLMDVSRAIRTARAKCDDWKLDPKRIGVIGFSAGGHLAANVSTRFDTDDRAADEINKVTARPDVAILCYPVITLQGVSVNVGSRRNLVGDHPSQALLDEVSCEKQVTPHTPTTFLFHTVMDHGVPVENSMMYAAALRKAGVACEMHLFEQGPHGVGLAQKIPALAPWPGLCATWLAGNHFGRGSADGR